MSTCKNTQIANWLSDWEICLSCAESPKSTFFLADLRELRYPEMKRSCIIEIDGFVLGIFRRCLDSSSDRFESTIYLSLVLIRDHMYDVSLYSFCF